MRVSPHTAQASLRLFEVKLKNMCSFQDYILSKKLIRQQAPLYMEMAVKD
ncbi:hypothetical protein LPE509_01889 [Legionella pneumophila subsp. pneumophila LPE509]|nr:hypothetical protein LPE509_01889 [Legionella pneumophila subsp. pneumophila LPE509]